MTKAIDIYKKGSLPSISGRKTPEVEILKPKPVNMEPYQQQIAIELTSLLVDSVRTGVAVWEDSNKVANEWERVRQQIALMDKSAEQEMNRLRHELEKYR